MSDWQYCKHCGCIYDRGFCTNCHEEIFIQEQYLDLDMDIPRSIVKKATEHINDINRVEQNLEHQSNKEQK